MLFLTILIAFIIWIIIFYIVSKKINLFEGSVIVFAGFFALEVIFTCVTIFIPKKTEKVAVTTEIIAIEDQYLLEGNSKIFLLAGLGA